MYELRQPSTPFGVVNETLDDTNIVNENRQGADYHSWYESYGSNWSQTGEQLKEAINCKKSIAKITVKNERQKSDTLSSQRCNQKTIW